MRLGINGRFLAALATGVQRFAHEVLVRLSLRAGVTLFLPSDVKPPSGLRVTVVRGRLRGHAWEQLELPRLAGGHCDVLLHPANSGAVSRTPFVLVLHDVLPLTHAEWFAPRFANWCRRSVPRAARGAARVVTVSEWSRREICRVTGAAPGRVVVAPQGLAPFDAPASDEAVINVCALYDLPSRFLLAVGDDVRKNVAFLETVVDRWYLRHGGAPLLVVAGGANERVHGTAPNGRAGNAHVRALGRVSDQELGALYTAAAALCCPALAEGFGRPPLEAIACGTPAVVAPYAASTEVLRGIPSARIVPLEIDAWIDALRSVSAAPPPSLLADAATLRARCNWDAAATAVLDACVDAHAERAVRRAAPRTLRAAARAEPVTPRARVAPRIAIVHDWLTGMRGGERVLEELLDLFPSADLFTLVHVPGSVSPAIESHLVARSFVDRLPGSHRAHRAYLPVYPAAAERLDVTGYALVLSSSHCAAKGVRTGAAPHLCYCHTPMRYLWDRREDYFGAGRASLAIRIAMAALAPRLRAWDVRSAARIDRIVANSAHVRDRIRTCWNRDAAVVHPPVDVERFSFASARDDYHVIAGALVPYKRVDLAVRAFNQLGRRLLVIGCGPEYARLRALAGASIEFTGSVGDTEMARLISGANALIMPMVEDFGIVAVEAQAAGTPVIALGEGGARETVIGWRPDEPAGATGVFFQEQTPESVVGAVLLADRIAFDPDVLRANARRFDRSVFRAGLAAHVDALLNASGAEAVDPNRSTGVHAGSSDLAARPDTPASLTANGG